MNIQCKAIYSKLDNLQDSLIDANGIGYHPL